MRINFFEKKYQYIGLDVNEHAIKALQFFRKGGHTSLKALLNAPLPKGLIKDNTFLDANKLSEFIKLNLGRPQFGSFSTKRVIISLPESKSFVRVMEMTAMEDSKAEVAIMFEAEAYIPVPMDQVYFDWQILSKTDSTMQVLLVASLKEYVDKFMEVIEDAGLKLCGIEVEAQSVARALVPSDVYEPVLIADIDALKTSLVMVEHGVLQFTSSVPVAGNTFSDQIVKELKLGAQEAEKLKRDVGLANTVEYPNLKIALAPVLENLASEIKNILKFHYDHSESHISKVLLTGGGAKLLHINDMLTPLLEQFAPIEVVVANPLEHVPNLVHSTLTPYEALSFTTPIGLALWERDIK